MAAWTDSGSWSYLQVSPDEGPAAGVVEVALHEEVEEVGGIAADGAQLGVAALEDFIAETGAHVGATVEERTRELEDGKKILVRYRSQKMSTSYIVFKEYRIFGV